MDVGFAGLGRMGRPMARHLAAAGHRVVAYDPAVHADTVPADLATAGVRVTDDPRQLGRAEVSLSMLPDAAATEALLLGEHGLLGGCGASHVHIVMGTVGPAAVRALAQKTRAAGVALVDAPVSGSVSLAEAGTITAMVGAEPAVFEAVRPVLAAMTRAQFRTGPVGSGSAAKLAVNLALASLNQAIAEALAVATPTAWTLRCSTTCWRRARCRRPTSRTSARRFESRAAGVAFPVSLLQKDIGLGLELAREHALELPLASTVGRVLERAREAGLADHDMAEILRLLHGHHRAR